jgi:hypothetical protein
VQYMWLPVKKEGQEENDQKESQEKEIVCPRMLLTET